MGLFSQGKPRGFHHEFMFADDRKDRLGKIEERVRCELGSSGMRDKETVLAKGVFLNATRYAGKRNACETSGRLVSNTTVILVLIFFLVIIWKVLLCL